MNADEYIKLAVRTEGYYDSAKALLRSTIVLRQLHAAMGIHTESGEIMDLAKRTLFYGETSCRKKQLLEELGDLMWYIALMCDATNLTLSEVMEANIAKLRARYPGGFTEKDATSRDLGAEAAAVDGRKV